MTARLADPKSVGSRGTMNRDRAAIIAARRIGVSTKEYVRRRTAGEKWCPGCEMWLAIQEFNADRHRSDGRSSKCGPCSRAYLREYLTRNVCVDCGSACMGAQRCAACWKARAERRAAERAAQAPYRRLAWAVYTAARLERQAQRAWRQILRRVFGGIAALARFVVRTERAERHAEAAAERDRRRAAKRARWFSVRAYPSKALSLDADIWEGEDFTRHEIISRVEDDTEYVVEQAEQAALLRKLVGDIGPEDVARMSTWDLERLQARLAEAGLAPRGVRQAERERLRAPNTHTGQGWTERKSRKGRRTRKQQVALMSGHRPAKKQPKRWDRTTGVDDDWRWR